MESKTDRISYLPKEIQNHIVSFLQMVDAVRTSVLSKQWRNICCSLSRLEFDEVAFDCSEKRYEKDFKDIVYQTLILHDGSDVYNFKLVLLDANYLFPHINAWSGFAVRHNVKEFDLEVSVGWTILEKLPYCLIGCKTLEALSLVNIKLKLSIVHGFPLLNKLSLDEVEFVDEDIPNQELILSSPLLENLELSDCFWDLNNTLVISSYNLKILKLYKSTDPHKIKITTSKLRYFSCLESSPPDLSSDTLSSVRDATFRFLTPHVSDEILSDEFPSRTWKIIMGLQNVNRLYLGDDYMLFLSRVQALSAHKVTPILSMKHLTVDMMPVHLVLFVFRIYPNLQTLNIYLTEHGPPTNILKVENDSQSQYLPIGSTLNHLKTVEIHEFTGCESEMEVVMLLIENASILEKMDICSPYQIQVSVSEKIMSCTKASSDAVISFSISEYYTEYLDHQTAWSGSESAEH